METAISVENLYKSYGSTAVLKGISFSIKKGEIFALLGINGAGKTTTLECMENIRKYDAGDIKLFGKTGVQLQSSSLPQNIKTMEAIKLFALWNKAHVSVDYLERLGVSQFRNKQYRELSTGQKRRLHLALSMIGNPEIVFLDEPTAGLDVEGRVLLHNEIRQIKKQGKTIVIASHDMAEVEELCDKLAILKKGNIAFQGTTHELTKQNGVSNILQVNFSKPLIMNNLKYSTFKGETKGYFTFETNSLTESLQELTGIAMNENCGIRDLKVEHDSLEQRFLDITREDE